MTQTPPLAAAPQPPPAAAPPPGAPTRLALNTLRPLSVCVFLAVALSSAHRAHGAGGVVWGVVSGAVIAGLFWIVAGYAVRTLSQSDGDATLLSEGELDTMLGPALRELETMRRDVATKIDQRMGLRLPLGLAGGVGAWSVMQFLHKPPGLVELAIFTAIGGGFGWALAAAQLSSDYTLAYKKRILPLLAGRFGALDWRKAQVPNLGQLKTEHIFAAFDSADADDEIFGTYRGLSLSIIELKLTEGSGKDQRTVFDGLLTRVELPRHLVGVTAIVADGGLMGQIAEHFRRMGQRERVRLESPDFEKVFDVYGSDQIAARALLTPAFMERLMTLGERAGFLKPTALAVDNQLTIALPKCDATNLFEPPDYSKPAANLAAVTKLSDDIAAVLRAADAVIDLDQASRAVAASAAR